MADKPTFRFDIGKAFGFVAVTRTDRASLCIGHYGGLMMNLDVSPTEARAVANALYEAADASEKVLPVVAAAVAA